MESRQGGWWQRIWSDTVSGTINVGLLRLPPCFAKSVVSKHIQTNGCHAGAAPRLQLCDVESQSAGSQSVLALVAAR